MVERTMSRDASPRAAAPDRAWLREAAFVVFCFLASRIALEIVGVLTTVLIGPHLVPPHAGPHGAPLWLGIWGVADTGWYLQLAAEGYDLAARADGPLIGQANWAFFPLYPMLGAAIAEITGRPLFPVLVAISNGAFLAALVVAARETAAVFGPSAGRWVVVLLCVMPGSYVFSSAYTESLYLLFCLVCLSAARRERWLLAGIAAALAATTRNLGIGLILPILISGLGGILAARRSGRATPWGAIARIGVAAALPMAALFGFCLFLYERTGDPLAFATIQKSWNRVLQLPFQSLVAALFGHGDAGGPEQALNWIAAVLALAATVVLVRERRWMLWSYGAFAVIVPLCTGPLAMLRYVVADAPVMMAAALVCARRPSLAPTVVAVAAVLNGYMMVCWSLGLPTAY